MPNEGDDELWEIKTEWFHIKGRFMHIKTSQK